MALRIGRLRAGLYCGERAWRVRTWHRRYGLWRRNPSGSFSLGPFLFWRTTAHKTFVGKLGGQAMRATTLEGRLVGLEIWNRVGDGPTASYGHIVLRGEEP